MTNYLIFSSVKGTVAMQRTLMMSFTLEKHMGTHVFLSWI